MIHKSSFNTLRIGQGTMGIGGFFSTDTSKDSDDISMLKNAIDMGLDFIDTAENYGDNHSEEVIGKAISGRRDKIFISTKASPENIEYSKIKVSCENSLRRLSTDYIDLYQPHWPNPLYSLENTIRALVELKKEGKIKYIGLSNYSLKDIVNCNESFSDKQISAIQLEYNPFNRVVENNILPYCQNNNIELIAYSPLSNNKIKYEIYLSDMAKKYNCQCSQLVLRWILSRKNTIAIPKTSKLDRIKLNLDSQNIDLEKCDEDYISNIFRDNYQIIDVNTISIDNWDSSKFNPKPEDLAKDILNGLEIKPIVVKKNDDNKYTLLEGKLRFMAFCIAYNKNKNIPSLIMK